MIENQGSEDLRSNSVLFYRVEELDSLNLKSPNCTYKVTIYLIVIACVPEVEEKD
jgi:hypothetical protein